MSASAMTAHDETMEGVGHVNIFVRVWQPTQTVRGVVIIVHGFNSHSGQYRWAAEQFTAAGLAVYALDLRGRPMASASTSSTSGTT